MSRHRNVRSMNYNEEYDTYYDVYGQSVEEEGCISPSTAAQFMYNRDDKNHSMSAYLSPDNDLPELDESDDFNISAEERQRTDSISLLPPNLSHEDKEKISSCVEEMQNVVGDTIGENTLARLALENNFNVEKALNAALSLTKGEEPKPQQVRQERTSSKELVGFLTKDQNIGSEISTKAFVIPKKILSDCKESTHLSKCIDEPKGRIASNPFKRLTQSIFGQFNEATHLSSMKTVDMSDLNVAQSSGLSTGQRSAVERIHSEKLSDIPGSTLLHLTDFLSSKPSKQIVETKQTFSLAQLTDEHCLRNDFLPSFSLNETSTNMVKPSKKNLEPTLIGSLAQLGDEHCSENDFLSSISLNTLLNESGAADKPSETKKKISLADLGDEHCNENELLSSISLNSFSTEVDKIPTLSTFGDPGLGVYNFASVSSPISVTSIKKPNSISSSGSSQSRSLFDLAQQHFADVSDPTESSLDNSSVSLPVLKGIFPLEGVIGQTKVEDEVNIKTPSMMPSYLPGLNTTSHDILNLLDCPVIKPLESDFSLTKTPSVFGFVLCMRLKIPNALDLGVKTAQVQNRLNTFGFNTASPDDLLKENQSRAFKDTAKPSIIEEPQLAPVASEESEVKSSDIPINVQEVTIDRKPEVSEAPDGNHLQLDKNRTQRSKSRSPSPAGFDAVDGLTPGRRAKPVHNPEELFSRERLSGKPLINLVVVGHVDAGKSTLMGHLLFRLGCVTKKIMHKNEQESKKLGKSSFMYAWVLDETPEERNRGITMDIAQSKFETPKRNVTLLDAPGHKDFIPNMITGAAQADVAILVIDATRGEFETGFEAGGQTREHTLLIRSLGVSQLAVAINKLDNVNWSEERYLDILSKLTSFLKQAGFKESDIFFVPCSGLTGDNLTENPTESPLSSWYKGPCLVDIIDQFRPPERPVTKPFRMCIADIFKGLGAGFCVGGRIESGILQNGDRVLVLPAGEQATVKGITIDEAPVSQVFAGDHVSLGLSGMDMNKVMCGDVICDPSKPVKVSTRFRARVVIFNIETPLTQGCPVVIHYQSMSEQAVVKKIISQLHKSTGEVVKKKPRFLLKNTSGLIELEVVRPVCVELYKDNRDLGRFMLRSMGTTVAAGLVTQVM